MSHSLLGEVNTQGGRLPRRERENLRQRREILDAALRLFSEKGYHRVSMHEIAKEAEFGIGTLYKFFDNKEELYKALHMEVAEKWHPAIMQTLEQERDPLRAIVGYVALRQQLFFENIPLMRLYYAETRGAIFNIMAGLDDKILRLHEEHMEKLASVFKKGVKAKVFRVLDPFHMALALDGTINAFLFLSMKDPGRFRGEDKLSSATDIFFKGVLNN